VRRENQPGDKRVSRIFVGTEAGKLLARLNVEVERTLDRAFRGMTAKQRGELLGALARVRDNLSAPEASPPEQPSGDKVKRRGR